MLCSRPASAASCVIVCSEIAQALYNPIAYQSQLEQMERRTRQLSVFDDEDSPVSTPVFLALIASFLFLHVQPHTGSSAVMRPNSFVDFGGCINLCLLLNFLLIFFLTHLLLYLLITLSMGRSVSRPHVVTQTHTHTHTHPLTVFFPGLPG